MQLYKRIKFISDIDGKRGKPLAEQLGINAHTFRGYLKESRQHLLEPYIEPILALHPEISRHWLITGEGQMLVASDNLDDEREQALLDEISALRMQVLDQNTGLGPQALTGFASCGAEGWGGTMTLAVPISPPQYKPGMKAVMAYGESMLPEGIGHGMVVWCDPGATPIAGECVYVEKRDGQAALKKYLGRGRVSGGGAVLLQGWRDKTGNNEPQKTFEITLADEDVATIAPVVYIQRRL